VFEENSVSFPACGLQFGPTEINGGSAVVEMERGFCPVLVQSRVIAFENTTRRFKQSLGKNPEGGCVSE